MGGFVGQNRGRGGAILTHNDLVLPFGGYYVCTNFGENWWRNATVRVLADGQIHWLTDANRFHNLSHAICYSYGQIISKKNLVDSHYVNFSSPIGGPTLATSLGCCVGTWGSLHYILSNCWLFVYYSKICLCPVYERIHYYCRDDSHRHPDWEMLSDEVVVGWRHGPRRLCDNDDEDVVVLPRPPRILDWTCQGYLEGILPSMRETAHTAGRQMHLIQKRIQRGGGTGPCPPNHG